LRKEVFSVRPLLKGVVNPGALTMEERAERFKELVEEIYVNFFEEGKERVRCFMKYYPDLESEKPVRIHYKLAELAVNF
jgi:hypothetical protein